MQSFKSSSKVKYVVIIGYVLVFIVMILGLITVYKNLVDFSERKVKDEDLRELVLVGNTISRLYDLESNQNFLSAENAGRYFQKYNSIVPEIDANIDTLKSLSKDSIRINKLDTITFLLNKKEENLQEIVVLLDSIRKAPRITHQTVSTYVPKTLNKQIVDYLERQNMYIDDEEAGSDTTVIKGERRRLISRLRDAIAGRQDSTVIIENRPAVTREQFAFAIDTVVNMIRYSERLNLERQKQFQYALLERQTAMSNTNSLLTARIDELLKGIEAEEMRKSIQLIKDKEETLARSQRTVYRVSWAAVMIALISGLLFLGDVNRSIRYRKQLEISNKKISDLLDLREMLMLSISHDIKAPASSIQGYLELMSGDVNNKKKSYYLQNMKNSTDHILSLVTNLLDFRKLRDGLWSKKEINFNLHDVADDIASSFEPMAEAKKLNYKITNSLPKNLTVFSDPYMIRQIIGNLISNAIKYTPEGWVDVNFNINNSGNQHSSFEFSVKDTGYGIGEEYKDVIFQEFKQLNIDFPNQKGEGNGLGLAIVRGLTEELGGKIHLESEIGKGSEFIVWLPLKNKHHIAAQQNNDVQHNNLQGVSVLAIDDDPMQLIMFSEMLRLKGAVVTTDSNPKNALEVLNNKKFDIIFIDIQMPQMNGLELVSQMPALNKPTPKIALSAKSEISLSDIRNHGFNDFLSKPFTSTDISKVSGKYLKNEETFVEDEKAKKSPGVFNLIDFVKEDKESSLSILHSFVQETDKNLIFLQQSIENGSMGDSSGIAHKMLPLFKMIGDKKIITILTKLETKQPITETEKKEILPLIQHHKENAGDLILTIERGGQ